MGLLSTFAFFPLCFSRSILDDPNFTDSLINLPFKPITYRLPDTGPSHCSSTPSSTAPPPTSSHPTAQPLRLLSAREQREQHNIVDKAGTAGRPAKTQHTPHTEHVAADMCEDVLLNALQNLMMEAFRGELDLTAHPRSVILPPASTRWRQTLIIGTHTHSNSGAVISFFFVYQKIDMLCVPLGSGGRPTLRLRWRQKTERNQLGHKSQHLPHVPEVCHLLLLLMKYTLTLSWHLSL